MPKLSIVKVKLDREVNSYIVSCATTKEAVITEALILWAYSHSAQGFRR